VAGITLKASPWTTIRESRSFWDKAGLDHNGGRLSGGGHIVWFISSRQEHIPQARWNAFLAEQDKLLANRKQP